MKMPAAQTDDGEFVIDAAAGEAADPQLDDLVHQIKRHHASAEKFARFSLEERIAEGEKLRRCRERVRGDWIDWFNRQHFPFKLRSAYHYIDLAEGLKEYPERRLLLVNCGLRDALKIVGRASKPEDARCSPKNDVGEMLLHRAIRGLVSEWVAFIRDGTRSGHPDLSTGTAAWHFVRAKYFGADYPRYLSFAFTPEQLSTPGGGAGSLVSVLENAIARDDDTLCERLKWLLGGDASLKHLISCAQIPIHDARGVLDFPAPLARDLIDEFCPSGGRILDPCHGWGGRLVGFLLASKPASYTGVDPSPVAHRGLNEIWRAFHPYAEKEKKKYLVQGAFEDEDLRGPFDFVLTSPPYYDTERYDGDVQSWRRYGDFDTWCNCFYRTLFEKTRTLLKPGAKFALVVGSQKYPLRERGLALAKATGFGLFAEREHVVKRNELARTTAEVGETLFVFRKENLQSLQTRWPKGAAQLATTAA